MKYFIFFINLKIMLFLSEQLVLMKLESLSDRVNLSLDLLSKLVACRIDTMGEFIAVQQMQRGFELPAKCQIDIEAIEDKIQGSDD